MQLSLWGLVFTILGLSISQAAIAQDAQLPYFLRSSHEAASLTKKGAGITQVRVHYNPNREHYQKYNYVVLKEALEITIPNFGPYEFKVGNYSSVGKRQAILLDTGDLMNVHWAPPDSEIASTNTIRIPVDFLYGLQGYRVCLVNTLRSASLKSIQSLEDLHRIRIGQGDNWSDNDIYTKNNISLYLAPTIESLFPPLGLNRFDCIALGVNEIRDLYNHYITNFDFLAIDESLLIYYEFPINFYVSKSSPELAARLTEGMKQLSQNGRLQELFNQFHPNLAELNLENRKLVCLTPLNGSKQACEMKLPTLKH